MFVVTVRVAGSTPLVALRRLAATAAHTILDANEGGNRCGFQIDAADEAVATCAAVCDRVVREEGRLVTECRPTRESTCALRRVDVAHTIDLLRSHGMLHSAVPDRDHLLLTFLVRAGGPADAARHAHEAAAAAGLRASVDVAPLTLEREPARALREIERETLHVALRMGYYDSPRRCTMDEIGVALGITKSAVHHRLAIVETKALRALAERDLQDP